jgi:GTP-binding protein Era
MEVPVEKLSIRCGRVAIVGRTNVGKSTFLNAALGEPLSIVSPRPQTTRDAVLGVVHRANAQLAFVDTPGVHRPKTELGRRMNSRTFGAAREADAFLFMTDVASQPRDTRRALMDNPPGVHPEDTELLRRLPSEVPAVLAINKIDRLRNKQLLLPLTVAYQNCRPFSAVVPTSCRAADGIERVLDELATLLPPGEAEYSEDTLTDRSLDFFVREYIREQVLLQTEKEVPHAVAISLDELSELPDRLIAKATIHVEKAGQRRILVGRAGSVIRDIGSAARQRIAQLTQKRVHLELFVRVTGRWKDAPRKLSELGYEEADAGRAGTIEELR